MKYRSWLLVPGNDEGQLGTSLGRGADVVVVDLSGDMSPDMRQSARERAANWLGAHRTNVLEHRMMGRWVRINPMGEGGHWREDLLAVIPTAPDGIMLPGATCPDGVRQLAAELYEIEQRCHIAANSTHIIPILGQNPESAMRIGDFLEAGHQRLMGLGWSASELAEAISATRCTEGRASTWTDLFRHVRVQTLLTARACGLVAVDALRPGCETGKALARVAKESRADGFDGMLATDPEQVAVLNEAFALKQPVLEDAREVEDELETEPAVDTAPAHKTGIDALGNRVGMHSEVETAAPILRPA